MNQIFITYKHLVNPPSKKHEKIFNGSKTPSDRNMFQAKKSAAHQGQQKKASSYEY